MNARDEKTPVQTLAESVETMIAEAAMLRHEVRVIDEKSQRDRKLLQWLAGLTALSLLLLGLTALIAYENHRNGDTLRDCIEPTGQCAQRNARQTEAVVRAITYRTEAERLRTEIGVAEAKGDTVAVENRKRRLAEVEAAIAEQDRVSRELQSVRAQS